jgi:5-(carboxyamino)imidazole ribonucleotide synthase
MLSLKAAQLGLRTHIYAPQTCEPAFEVAAFHTCASYGDEDALRKFAQDVDVVTYEFENVPSKTVALLSSLKTVLPPPRALAIAQDRLAEKKFIQLLNFPLAAFHAVNTVEDIQDAVNAIGLPAVLKTQRLGYDGKGQALVKNLEETQRAFSQFAQAASVLEAFINLKKEISVLVVRGRNNETVVYDAIENVHRNHILQTSTVPASISASLERQAKAIALQLIEGLDYTGTLAVEFFIDKDDHLLVNEIAPRVHNSGHLTLDACLTCQFENHIRAIAGWPLGRADRTHNAIMTNLIGNEVNNWQNALSDKDNCLWIYGKTEAKPGRKMGHVTKLLPLA